eukprot:Hpha_TRINITY_DN11887_c0_g1::TRINITY_DN11887_c0_g1_i1::g.2191::m.2191
MPPAPPWDWEPFVPEAPEELPEGIMAVTGAFAGIMTCVAFIIIFLARYRHKRVQMFQEADRTDGMIAAEAMVTEKHLPPLVFQGSGAGSFKGYISYVFSLQTPSVTVQVQDRIIQDPDLYESLLVGSTERVHCLASDPSQCMLAREAAAELSRCSCFSPILFCFGGSLLLIGSALGIVFPVAKDASMLWLSMVGCIPFTLIGAFGAYRVATTGCCTKEKDATVTPGGAAPNAVPMQQTSAFPQANPSATPMLPNEHRHPMAPPGQQPYNQGYQQYNQGHRSPNTSPRSPPLSAAPSAYQQHNQGYQQQNQGYQQY